MTKDIQSAEYETYKWTKAIYQPTYEQLIENFNKNKEYINKSYVCRHFARDNMEYLNKLGYENHIETGYYNNSSVHHAINILYVPISNGKVMEVDYLKDWNKTMWYKDLETWSEFVNQQDEEFGYE